MELQFYGANCIRIITKRAAVVIDDNLSDLGQKSATKAGDVALFTHEHGIPKAEVKLVIGQPGEYEVSEVSVRGIAQRAHVDEAGRKTATIFKLVVEDIRVAILGHVYPSLNNDQLEQLGTVDVLIVPVGGSGYTTDPVGALKLIRAIEPKIIIPTHYADSSLNYPVPQQSLEQAIHGLAMEPKETLAKLKLKPGELTDVMQLIVLEKQ